MKLDHIKVKTYLSGLLIAFLIVPFIFSNEAWCEENIKSIFIRSTPDARLAVEKAWDTYHHAALGGTLASPMVQTELETNLHKSRALLAEAYDAEDRGDMKTVYKLINQIIRITEKVINESQEPKT